MFDFGYIAANFWPVLFLLIPGLAMHSIYFSGKSRDAGILVPGGILLVLGVTFQIFITFNIWQIVAPGAILSVAFGLFELYAFGNRNKGLLIPVTILSTVAIVLFSSFTLGTLFISMFRQFFIPAVLILIGFSIIAKNGMGKR
jgi:hypothetical protein